MCTAYDTVGIEHSHLISAKKPYQQSSRRTDGLLREVFNRVHIAKLFKQMGDFMDVIEFERDDDSDDGGGHILDQEEELDRRFEYMTETGVKYSFPKTSNCFVEMQYDALNNSIMGDTVFLSPHTTLTELWGVIEKNFNDSRILRDFKNGEEGKENI